MMLMFRVSLLTHNTTKTHTLLSLTLQTNVLLIALLSIFGGLLLIGLVGYLFHRMRQSHNSLTRHHEMKVSLARVLEQVTGMSCSECHTSRRS